MPTTICDWCEQQAGAPPLPLQCVICHKPLDTRACLSCRTELLDNDVRCGPCATSAARWNRKPITND